MKHNFYEINIFFFIRDLNGMKEEYKFSHKQILAKLINPQRI